MATAFPSGRASLAVKLADVADAINAGADEVDMVIDRGAFLSGRYGQVYEEVRAVREACGPAHLKVILETAELATLDNVARASWLAMLAGADFIKTSTGKVSPAATPVVAHVMLAAVRDFAEATGRRVGVKVAGGVRTAKDAIRYLVLVKETAGEEWLTPDAVPHRCLQPAQRPADAAQQAAHRRLRRPRLLHAVRIRALHAVEPVQDSGQVGRRERAQLKADDLLPGPGEEKGLREGPGRDTGWRYFLAGHRRR